MSDNITPNRAMSSRRRSSGDTGDTDYVAQRVQWAQNTVQTLRQLYNAGMTVSSSVTAGADSLRVLADYVHTDAQYVAQYASNEYGNGGVNLPFQTPSLGQMTPPNRVRPYRLAGIFDTPESMVIDNGSVPYRGYGMYSGTSYKKWIKNF